MDLEFLVVQSLAGADVQALFRRQSKRAFPKGVTEIVAALANLPSMREALTSARTPFLLNSVTPDDLTQALRPS